MMMENKPKDNKKPEIGAGMAIGISLGAAFGVALNNLAIGLALGVAIGASMEGYKRKKSKDKQ